MNAHIALVTVLLILAFEAQADVTVTITPSNGGQVTSLTQVSGKWRVEVQAFAGGNVEFLIRGDTTDPIEWILVDGDNPGYWSKLFIKGASGNFDIPSIDQVGLMIGHGGGDVWIAEMKSSGDVGNVSAQRINDLQVLGDFVGNIYIYGASAIVEGLDLLEVGGDFLGSIPNDEVGFIGTISVAGTIGGALIPSYIATCGGIVSIEAASIEAGINAGGAFCPGILGRLATTSGDFVGFLQCNGLGGINSNDGIYIAGDCDTGGASLNVGDEPLAPIVIGGSFDGTVFLPYQQIAHQITINAANLGGDWNGDVYHGSIAIGPGETQPNQAPYYDATSASIGGGAIGLIPYHLHDVDSTPDNGASIAANPTTTVVICHYGPVWWDSEETPFIIDWSETGEEEWETLPEEDFTYTRGANHRDVTITAETEFDFKEGFDYRIRPNPGVLKCELGGNTINVASYTYILHGS